MVTLPHIRHKDVHALQDLLIFYAFQANRGTLCTAGLNKVLKERFRLRIGERFEHKGTIKLNGLETPFEHHIDAVIAHPKVVERPGDAKRTTLIHPRGEVTHRNGARGFRQFKFKEFPRDAVFQ